MADIEISERKEVLKAAHETARLCKKHKTRIMPERTAKIIAAEVKRAFETDQPWTYSHFLDIVKALMPITVPATKKGWWNCDKITRSNDFRQVQFLRYNNTIVNIAWHDEELGVITYSETNETWLEHKTLTEAILSEMPQNTGMPVGYLLHLAVEKTKRLSAQYEDDFEACKKRVTGELIYSD